MTHQDAAFYFSSMPRLYQPTILVEFFRFSQFCNLINVVRLINKLQDTKNMAFLAYIFFMILRFYGTTRVYTSSRLLLSPVALNAEDCYAAKLGFTNSNTAISG